MKQAIGKAHGKIILIGEHSVVHGYPAIALPFPAVEIEAAFTAVENESYLVSELYAGPLLAAPASLASLTALYQQMRTDHQLNEQHWLITITSTIPAERGMGSSAALAGALVRGFFAALKQPLSKQQLLHYVDFAEKICHGNPSGLDARIVSLNKPMFYQKGHPLQEFQFTTPYWLVIADTGISGNTKKAVQAVQAGVASPFLTRQLAVHSALKQLGSLTEDLHLLLQQQDHAPAGFAQLAAIIRSAHDQLRLLQVSSPELDNGVAYCLAHGAGAAKLTGGGRGGCYFALVEHQHEATQLAQRLITAKVAVQTWQVPFTSEFKSNQNGDAYDN